MGNQNQSVWGFRCDVLDLGRFNAIINNGEEASGTSSGRNDGYKSCRRETRRRDGFLIFVPAASVCPLERIFGW